MADCTDPQNQKISAANPAAQAPNAGALQVNLDANPASIFNPYNALSAVNTYLSINTAINKMLGIETRWFRAVPQERSKDVILQEWTLSCVEETPLCVKVLLPEGAFPDSKYQYDLMGLEYEVPLTVHIDKKYWEELAGFGTAPQKKDIVYLPLPNKLYQVESTYLKRGFLEQETHWVINLKKYMPEASRREPAALKDTIDKYTVSTEEIFGEQLQDEYAKLTNDKQFSPFNSTTRDKYKSLDPELKIIVANLEIYGVMVSDAYYDMRTSLRFNGIIYEPSDIIEENSNRAITAWIQPKTRTTQEYRVKWIQKDLTVTPPANYKIKIENATRFSIGDTFVISRPGALNFYAVVIDDTNALDGIYFCKIDEDVEDYLYLVNPSWPDAKNYRMVIKDPITILDGINETNTGFRVRVYANQFVKIDYGFQERVAALSERMMDDTWYGLVVNLGNSWGLYSVTAWEIDPNDSVKKLKILSSKTLNITPERTQVGAYSVDKSDAFITNIRLFTTTIEEEKQPTELLSYFTKDSDQALILDNADPKLGLPYISKKR